ncbi:hypothetical protein HK097_010731, partial [Rhizophlyctis rosea]
MPPKSTPASLTPHAKKTPSTPANDHSNGSSSKAPVASTPKTVNTVKRRGPNQDGRGSNTPRTPQNPPTPGTAKSSKKDRTGRKRYKKKKTPAAEGDEQDGVIESDPIAEMEWAEPVVGDDQGWRVVSSGGGSLDVKRIAFSADSRYMLVPVGSNVKVYSVATGKVIRVLKREAPTSQKKPTVVAIQWHPTEASQTYIAYDDGTIRLWAVLEGTIRQEWKHPSPITHFILDPNNPTNTFLLTITSPASQLQQSQSQSQPTSPTTAFVTFNLSTNKVVASKHKFRRRILAFEVSQDRDWLVVADETMFGVVRLGGTKNGGGGEMRRYYPDEDIQSIAIHPTEGYVAVGEKTGKITSWYCLGTDEKSQKNPVKSSVHWHANQVNALAFTSDGTYMLSGGEESVLVIWQLGTKHKDFLPRLGWTIQSLTVTPDQQHYAVGLGNNSVLVIGAAGMKIRMSLAGVICANMDKTKYPSLPTLPHLPQLSSLILPGTPGTLQIYAPESDTHIQTIETSTSTRLLRSSQIEIPQPFITTVGISQDGKWMATVEERERKEEGGVQFGRERWLKFW